MQSKSIILLALALGCGLVASIGISQVMDRRNVAEAPAGEMEPVFVAAVNLNYNDELTPDKLKLEEWPKDKIQPGALRTLEEIKGKRTATKLFAGEQIVAMKLMGAEGMAGAARKIPKGYRVISVKVDAVTGAGSLILPDDRVDVLVYLARNPGSGIMETSTKTILQDVRVFAVDTQFERRHGSDEPTIAAKTISLLVTSGQAEKVTLATELGQIRLVMRSPDDTSESSPSGAGVQDIFGSSEHGVREAEDAHPAPPAADTLSWLDKQKQAEPPPAAPVPQVVAPVVPKNWKMVLLEGGEMRSVDLSGEDAFPDILSDTIIQNPTLPQNPQQAPADQQPAQQSADDGSDPVPYETEPVHGEPNDYLPQPNDPTENQGD
jgi:pilus assembly protein CpaB